MSTVAEKAPRIFSTAARTAASRSPCGLVGDEGRDDLGVGGGGELDALRAQLVAQRRGVDEVAVVPEGDRAAVAPAHEGLRVLPAAAPGGRVAHVADRHLPAEAGQRLLVEHLRDEPHLLDHGDLTVVGDGDAGALLTAMLQGVEAEEGEARHVALGRDDAEDAATVV